MVHACVRGWRPGRGPSVIASVLLLGGLCVAATLSDLARAAQGEGKAPREAKKAAVPVLAPFTHAVDAKTPGFNDVSEMVKTINEKLRAEWEKNKISPLRHVD